MRVAPFSVPVDSLSTASGTIEERSGFVVGVDRGDARGIGEATPFPGWTESREECAGALRRAVEADGYPLAGVSADDAPAARHGVELALSDVDARINDLPLYRFLGGAEEVRYVPVNATIGDSTVDETVEQAEAAVEEGFDCLKLKVGSRAVIDDVRRVGAVRRAVGPDVELRADANGAWDRSQAERALSSFADADVRFVEQPLPRNDVGGLAALSGGEVSVAADESLAVAELETVLDAVDVVVCKPMILGGPVRAREVAMRARDAGVTPVVTTTIDAVVARTAAVHVAASLPDVPACGLATADLLLSDVADDPAPVEDGAIHVPQTPGVGVDPLEVFANV